MFQTFNTQQIREKYARDYEENRPKPYSGETPEIKTDKLKNQPEGNVTPNYDDYNTSIDVSRLKKEYQQVSDEEGYTSNYTSMVNQTEDQIRSSGLKNNEEYESREISGLDIDKKIDYNKLKNSKYFQKFLEGEKMQKAPERYSPPPNYSKKMYQPPAQLMNNYIAYPSNDVDQSYPFEKGLRNVQNDPITSPYSEEKRFDDNRHINRNSSDKAYRFQDERSYQQRVASAEQGNTPSPDNFKGNIIETREYLNYSGGKGGLSNHQHLESSIDEDEDQELVGYSEIVPGEYNYYGNNVGNLDNSAYAKMRNSPSGYLPSSSKFLPNNPSLKSLQNNVPQYQSQADVSELIILKSKNLELQQSLHREQENSKVFEMKYVDILNQLEGARVLNEELKNRLHLQSQTHQNGTNLYEERIANMNQKTFDLQRNEENLKKELENVRRKMIQEINMKNRIEEELKDNNFKIEDMNFKIREGETVIEKKTEELNSQKKSFETLRAENQNLKQANEKFQDKIRDQDRQIHDLKEEVETLRKKNQDMKVKEFSQESELEKLRNENHVVNRQMQDSLRDNENFKNEIYNQKQYLLESHQKEIQLNMALEKSNLEINQIKILLNKAERNFQEQREQSQMLLRKLGDSSRAQDDAFSQGAESSTRGPSRPQTASSRGYGHQRSQESGKAHENSSEMIMSNLGISNDRGRLNQGAAPNSYQPTRINQPSQTQDNFYQPSQAPQINQQYQGGQYQASMGSGQYQAQYQSSQQQTKNPGSQANQNSNLNPSLQYQYQAQVNEGYEKRGSGGNQKRANNDSFEYENNSGNKKNNSSMRGVISWEENQNPIKTQGQIDKNSRNKSVRLPRNEVYTPDVSKNTLADESNRRISDNYKKADEEKGVSRNYNQRYPEKTEEMDPKMMQNNKRPEEYIDVKTRGKIQQRPLLKNEIAFEENQNNIKQIEGKLMALQIEKSSAESELKKLEDSKIRSAANLQRKRVLEEKLANLGSDITVMKTKLREMNALHPY